MCQWQYSGEEHEVRKEYLTLVEGVPTAASGVVDEAVDGLPARSEWHLQDTFRAPGTTPKFIPPEIPLRFL